MPASLKPAPRLLAMQLWALKHGGSEKKALDAMEQLAGSGRTSIAADEEIPKAFYRVAGYRVCGGGAGRGDLLGRLAPALLPAPPRRPGGRPAKTPGCAERSGCHSTSTI